HLVAAGDDLRRRECLHGTQTQCPIAAEPAFAAPQIITGRNEVGRYVPVRGAGSVTPLRIRVPSLAIDVPVATVGVDTANGVLGVPTDIHRAGWWRDGAVPGDRAGAVLIAGHVDSATAGAGAFFRLHRVRRGDRV